MNTTSLLDVLKVRPMVCDGAMGTQMMGRGLQAGECGEAWNVDRPGDIEAIHRAFREVGCDFLTTNTFGATSSNLAKHGRADQVVRLNRSGAEIARRVAGQTAWVLGDVGPFGGFLEPLGDMTAEQLSEVFARQIDALYAGGADGIIVETMTDPVELAIAVRSAKQLSERPVVATYAFDRGDGRNFRTMMGIAVEDALAAALEAGADVVGANCGTSMGLEDYARLADQLVRAGQGRPVIVQPNAGAPKTVDGKLVYGATPEDMAKLAGQLLKAGVRLIGGCCGTRPEHLAAVRSVVGSRQGAVGSGQ